jgi:uncharacterized protein (TIGR00266 family)
MIEFSCPSCSKKYKVDDSFAGRKARCKECGNTMPIPGGDVKGAGQPDSVRRVASAEAQRPQRTSQAAGQAPRGHNSASQPRQCAAAQRDNGASEVLNGSTPHFDYEISQRPDFALVTIRLQEGQKVFAETSAMASMTPTVSLKAGFKGGLGKTLGRALGGESMIINTFTADKGTGEVTFAAGATGDAAHYTLTGNTLMLQRGAFMLHSEGVEVTGKWQGAKGFFGGEGLVLLKASGDGEIFFNSYGAILSVNVTDEYIVDTGYIVAFEDTLNYDVSVLPGLRGGSKLKTLFFGGEGLVCRFSGQGRVWIQTRHVQSFLSWVNAFRPSKKN